MRSTAGHFKLAERSNSTAAGQDMPEEIPPFDFNMIIGKVWRRGNKNFSPQKMAEILKGLKPSYLLVNQYIVQMLDCGVGCHAGCMRSIVWLLGFFIMKTRAHYTDVVEYLRSLRPCMNFDEV